MSHISSTLIVDGTLWTLVLFSLVTWSLIVSKGIQHFRLSRRNRRYTQAFWTARSFASAANLNEANSPIARIGEAGFTALRGASDHAQDLEHSWDRQDLLERSLRQQIQKERRHLERGLAVLASIGSTAPFVGLFGTVWGIMHALTNIGKQGSASIEVVAGPIGEALIATGIGIAVAVPAVLAYNYFQRQLKSVAGDLDDFATDFINLAQKNAFLIPAAAPVKVAEKELA